ncbi:MAG TPA: S53 family peptidase [Terracidiphilus sp.]|nr:S53 family peptidase [Terracidiphilus sp.]
MTGKAARLCSALGVVALFLSFSAPAARAADRGFSAIGGKVQPTTDTDTGSFSSSQMTVEIVLAPRNAPQLSSLLTNLYDANSPSFQHWLAKGEFLARFAPTSAQINAVATYLRESGLDVGTTSSPFLLRVSGPSSMMETTFHTALHNYRNRRGISYYSNASEIQLPETLASGVLAVVGLSNTVRPHAHIARPAHHTPPPVPSCEAPYPTVAEFYNAVNNGVGFPFGYGGSPGCNGLTPDQTNSIYGAPNLGPAARGAGVNLAVFELSAYQHSDIDAWTEQFYGPKYKAQLVDINVDGGPLAPICPMGDQCPAAFEGYAGDIEVDADIEMQLAVAPDVRRLLVYNAPNDFTGQTELDEYTKIADDDLADVISSSWGVCENDAGAGYAQAENLLFEQMALQGQSMFGAAGDTGAFDCIRTDGTTIVNVDDPPSQPWVTSVGGTSLESFNPNANPDPNYPKGIETVWNVDNLCNTNPNEGNLPGLEWCALTGAGGGGNSQFWGRPLYQNGPGVTNPYTAYGNGATHCALAPIGKPCREVPDISANADEYTPYAEYCTGSTATPNSQCTFSAGDTPAGWFGIGGTSLSSPLWSAIIADHDSLWHSRMGNANPLLYLLYDFDAPGYFNDITGVHQTTNNNGLFPTTPGYDLATGIGTPKMGAIITLIPQR